jgi:hypothetical protein
VRDEGCGVRCGAEGARGARGAERAFSACAILVDRRIGGLGGIVVGVFRSKVWRLEVDARTSVGCAITCG